MESIGDKLREARARQGTDLADVEAKTKIRSRYLRALEDEQFHLLPGHAYARSFLRTYADLLGLDSQELVQEYRYQAEGEPRPGEVQAAAAGQTEVATQRRPEIPPLEPEPEQSEPEPQRRPGPQRRGASPWQRQLESARAALAGAAVSAREATERVDRRMAVIIAAGFAGLVALVVVVALLASSGGEPNKAASVGHPAPPPPPPPAPAPPPVPQQVTLTVVPAGRTYLCVDTGPQNPALFSGIIYGPRTFSGNPVRVTLGNQSGSLQVNGRPFPLGPDLGPVGYEFTPTGQRLLSPDQRPCPAATTSSSSTSSTSTSTSTNRGRTGTTRP